MIYTHQRTQLMIVPRSILVVNLDPAISSFFMDALSSEGYAVQESYDIPGECAWAAYDLVIFGVQPIHTGEPLQLTTRAKKIRVAHAKLLVCSTSAKLLEQQGLACDPNIHTLVLPCDLDELYAAVERALDA